MGDRRRTTWTRAAVIAVAAAAASLVAVTPAPVEAATIVVDDNGDSIAADGVTTLREAVANAGPGDTIQFHPSLIGDTITLSGPLLITDDLVITGLGISALTVQSVAVAGPTLAVGSGAALTITDLRVGGVNTGIEAKNSGDVQIDRVVVSGGVTGIDFDSPGADLRLTGTFVDAHSGRGIVVDRSDQVALTDSTARDNGAEGLQATGPTSAVGSLRLSNADVSRNGAAGLEANVVGDVIVNDSFLEDNVGVGLHAQEVGGDVSIARTSALRNGSSGIALGGGGIFGSDGTVGGTVVLDDVNTSENGDPGLFIPGLFIRGTDADSIAVTRSTSSANAGIGVLVQNLQAELVLDDTEVDDNGSTGLNVDGGTSSGVIEISDARFRRNAQSGIGLEAVDGNVTIVDTLANANGGNGVVVSSGTSGDITVERVLADGNEIGIGLSDISGSVEVVDSTVSNSNSEGIVLADNTAPATVERTTFTGNFEAFAGLGAASSARIVNSTFTANGPGEVVQSGLASLAITHSTIAGNPVDGGASLISVFDGGSVSLDHTIATGNGAGPLSIVDPGSTLSATHSLVPVGSNLGATNIEVADPEVGSLADNGGETETMLPALDSPAVDAGDVQIATPPGTDQRGKSRISGAAIDVGSVELPGEAAITSLAPARFVDTRDDGDTFDDRFQADGRRSADSEYRVQLAGRGEVPADAQAVVVNVTAVGADRNGFVTVHPCADPRPVASSLNYTAGVNLPNELVAPLTPTGELCIYTNRAIHVLVDVVGFVDARSPLRPLTPARYLDTRPGRDTFDDQNEGAGIPGAASTTTLPVAGRGAVPADAVAVIVNVTAVGAEQRGFVTVHPCLPTPPLASSLNHVAQVNRANELIASVDASGDICLFTSRAIHLVVDVVGYLPAGSGFSATPPARFLDSRETGETVDGISAREGKLEAGEQYQLQIAGRSAVPDSASAVVVNVTAAAPETRGFVTVHPCVDPRPNASSLNYVAAVNGANELITQLDADGRICLYTNRRVHLVVDVVGYLE